MLLKLLSSVIYLYKKLTTPRDYTIIKEELEYSVDYDTKYQVEDEFWKNESKDWDGILENFYVNVTGLDFRNTYVPQNVNGVILRTKYVYNGHVYSVVTNDLNFSLRKDEGTMHFSIPLSSAWMIDHDDKPMVNITEKVKRYAGPRCDFHMEKIPIKDLLYYEYGTLKTRFPKIMLINTLGMKKIVSTTDNFTTDLRIP